MLPGFIELWCVVHRTNSGYIESSVDVDEHHINFCEKWATHARRCQVAQSADCVVSKRENAGLGGTARRGESC